MILIQLVVRQGYLKQVLHGDIMTTPQTWPGGEKAGDPNSKLMKSRQTAFWPLEFSPIGPSQAGRPFQVTCPLPADLQEILMLLETLGTVQGRCRQTMSD